MSRRKLKRFVEKSANGKIWIDHASSTNDVASLIADLKPVSIENKLVRFGKAGDGGYIIPDDLDGIEAVVSPGVSTEVSFDLSWAERGVDVFMADASVEGPPVQHDRFHFQKKFLDCMDGPGKIRLDTMVRQEMISANADWVLQMDIEGSEYQVLLDATLDTLSKFRIMVIEFHDLDALFSRVAYRMIHSAFRKILMTHEVVHIHPNNCMAVESRGGLDIPPIMEFTFYRKDRVKPAENKKAQIPHPLDQDCVTYRPSLVLPNIWWR